MLGEKPESLEPHQENLCSRMTNRDGLLARNKQGELRAYSIIQSFGNRPELGYSVSKNQNGKNVKGWIIYVTI